MGNLPSSTTASTFQTCLDAVCAGRDGCAAYPGTMPPLAYQIAWVRPYNLDIAVTPVAVVRPDTAQDVAGFVKCAAGSGVKVQARSGGHSFGNYGIGGGEDGGLMIDLANLQQFSMDSITWEATIGAGTHLSDVTSRLHDSGGRAIAHGTCPGVGIGGHATIGGLGPMSRMWGSCLDHVVEVEAVTAGGDIVRANAGQNLDLFFALKGAAAGFAIVTEFTVMTHKEPGAVVQHHFSHSFGTAAEMASLFAQWQALAGDPSVDRRFGSEFVLHALGATITATFYGTEAEFAATGILGRLPDGTIATLDWLGAVEQQAQDAAMWLSDASAPFVAKSLAFRQADLLTDGEIAALLAYMDGADKGTAMWFLIFDMTGGAVADVAMNATAYSHRDKVMFAQAYGVGIPAVAPATRAFISGIMDTIRSAAGAQHPLNSTYPGYVDPALADGQESYWGPNLARLEAVKAEWDPADVFHNRQSVRPKSAGTATGPSAV